MTTNNAGEKDIYASMMGNLGKLKAIQEELLKISTHELYQAMARHETDLKVLDSHADHILGIASMGIETAIEDYTNYLEYIRTINPSVYPEYQQLFEEVMNPETAEEDDCDLPF